MEASVVARGAFVRALEVAHRVRLGAFALPSPEVVSALEAAAEHGGQVEVVLAGGPRVPVGLRARNARTAAALQAHGVSARLDCSDPPLHGKAALVDGALYLDGRNFNEGDLIVRDDDAADAEAVGAALNGGPLPKTPAAGVIATEKGDALTREAALITGSTDDRIDLVSESFGGCAVTSALNARLAAGVHVRLIVSEEELRGPQGGRERATLDRLAAMGATVRVGRANDKLCVTGSRAWLGSANASWTGGCPFDWGFVSADPALVEAARARFEADWRSARPLPQAGARVVA